MKSILILLVALTGLTANAQWKNTSELSMIVTGGNTELETYNLKSESIKEMDKNTYSFGGHYTLGTQGIAETDAAGNETGGFDGKKDSARNWDVHARYARVMSAKMAAFFNVQFEGNEFAGYKQRQNYDLGAKYTFTKDDKVNSFVTLAYRYTIEAALVRDEDGDDVFNDSKGVVYYELNKMIRKGFSYKFWIEYVANFSRSEDYLINFEPSLMFAMNDTFSVKLAYKGMYDNEPNAEGLEMMDWQYTTALIANF